MQASFDTILDYYAQLNTSFLHGAGLAGTIQLIEQGKLAGNEQVFELGCGTGSSLVFLAQNFPQLRLSGGDISSTMLSKAKKRIGYSGLSKRIQLQKLQVGQVLPFPARHFDVVWIESVLAFQSVEKLQKILFELHRILRPEGKLLLNETVWLVHTTASERQRINDYCKKHFGIIQALNAVATVEDWVQLLEKHGFARQSVFPLDETKASTKMVKNLGSTIFDLWGKLKRTLHPGYRKQNQTFKQLEAAVFPSDQQVMQAYTMVFQKNSG